MVGVAFEVRFDGMDQIRAAMAGLDAFELADVAFDVGQILENSVKERIATEKRAPDGTPWQPWSEVYAATRSKRHSLLVGEGDLRDSIQNYTTGLEAVVGTNLVYGAIHQFGGKAGRGRKVTIPARPYLGLSDEDAEEIRALILDDWEDALQ